MKARSGVEATTHVALEFNATMMFFGHRTATVSIQRRILGFILPLRYYNANLDLSIRPGVHFAFVKLMAHGVIPTLNVLECLVRLYHVLGNPVTSPTRTIEPSQAMRMSRAQLAIGQTYIL